ncbi:hypothetical protein ACWKWP_12835 [Agromyces soli]
MEAAIIPTVLMAAFVVVIAVGMIVRLVRAPRGTRSRLRHAFGPIAGAGETWQELHTGQRGLQDSIIEAVQEQEHGGARRENGESDEGDRR